MKIRVVLLLVGVALLTVSGIGFWSVFNQFQPEPVPPAVATPLDQVLEPEVSSTTTMANTATTTSTTVPPSTTSTTEAVIYGRPAHLSIEQIGVDDPIVGIPLNPDRDFEAEPFTVAWYNGSVWPGQPGPMLIGAHVAWKELGPDRFARLTELRPEDQFQLTNELDEVFTYVVTDIYEVNKETEFSPFIEDVVYANEEDHVAWLLTCGGELRPTGSFADNIFVRAVLIPEEG